MQKKEEASSEPALLKAKSDALRLLSFRPRSIQELKDRLRLKKYPAPVIEDVVEILKKQGLLDDAKFARLFANSRVYTRPSGKRQLEIDLKKKGLQAPLIAETLGNLQDYDEKKMAADLARPRFEHMTGISKEKKKTRLYGFLKRRGFGDDIIFGVLDRLLKVRNESFESSDG